MYSFGKSGCDFSAQSDLEISCENNFEYGFVFVEVIGHSTFSPSIFSKRTVLSANPGRFDIFKVASVSFGIHANQFVGKCQSCFAPYSRKTILYILFF